MLADLQKVIWGHELKRFKALAVREQLRREYDQANDALTRIQAHPEQANEEIKTQTKQIEQRVNYLKGRMDDMDLQINGELPSETNEGSIGITQELETLIESREYIKAFVKHNV